METEKYSIVDEHKGGTQTSADLPISKMSVKKEPIIDSETTAKKDFKKEETSQKCPIDDYGLNKPTRTIIRAKLIND